MRIDILISTANERINNLNLQECKDVRNVVVHQVYDEVCLSKFDAPKNTIYQRLNYPGLSKSRNVALKLSNANYAYIMDDDVAFDVLKVQRLVSQMEKEGVDVATCQFRYEDGSFPKRYKKTTYRHNMISVAKVSSIEICVNLSSIKKNNIIFDEKFGLGTGLPSGEEYIFLADCLKSGLKVKYYPILIGIHPNETSGQDFYTSSSKVLAKREMLKRIFGWKAFIFVVLFWLKKSPEVIKRGYFKAFTKTMFLGVK